MKQLLLAVGVIALCLGVWVWWFRDDVTVRPATRDDPVYQRYFGIHDEGAKIRNIAVVRGTFSKSTWLSAELCLVQSGTIDGVNAMTVGRSPNRIGESLRLQMTITLALGEYTTDKGRVTKLGTAGQTRGSGNGDDVPHNVVSKHSQSFTGLMTRGREYVIYAEGDTEICLTPEMALREFAQRNTGDYLVVIARLD